MKFFCCILVAAIAFQARSAIRLVEGDAIPASVQLVYKTHFGISVVDDPNSAEPELPRAQLRYIGYQSNRFLPFFFDNDFLANVYQWPLRNTGQSVQRIHEADGSPYNTEPGAVGAGDIRVTNAWAKASTWNKPICILDTGVCATHPDLISVLPGVHITAGSFAYGQSDEGGHGTFIAGIISAGTGPNLVSDGHMQGVAPRTPILPAQTDISLPALLMGIDWAVTSGAKIINCSWGFPGSTPPQGMEYAVAYCQLSNVVLVCAGQNRFYNTDAGINDFPIQFSLTYGNILAVGSLNPDGSHTVNSPVGSIIVDAPGRSLVSCGRFPASAPYVYGNGTSFATPHVAAVVALAWATHPTFTASQIVSWIRSTTTASAGGYPRILNAEAATGNGSPPPPPPPPIPPTGTNGGVIRHPAFTALSISGGVLTINRTNTTEIQRSADLQSWQTFRFVTGSTNILLDNSSPYQFYRLRL